MFVTASFKFSPLAIEAVRAILPNPPHYSASYTQLDLEITVEIPIAVTSVPIVPPGCL
jgi:hypothetical protein